MTEEEEMKLFEKELEESLSKQTNTTPPPQQGTKVTKDLVIGYISDSAGCGHIRTQFPMSYFNSVFARSGTSFLVSPTFIWQQDILMRSRSLFFQRQMSPGHLNIIQTYKQHQPQFQYKMIWDMDDFIWERNELQGGTSDTGVPSYNFGHIGITEEVVHASKEIMKLMDVCTFSTPYLADYAKNELGIKNTLVIPNSIPKFFWGNRKKRQITSKIVKPRVLYTGSPTHYRNMIPAFAPGQNPQFPNGFGGLDAKLGDFENSWKEWCIKNVKEDKIEFIIMGGTPWFFEEIKNRSNVTIINWVPSFNYHNEVINSRADFGIMPLVPNKFNYSKSDIKAIEYYAAGIVAIGNTFDNGNPSPYDKCPVKLDWNASVEQIDEVFWNLTNPESYNIILSEQYNIMNNEGRYTESKKYVDHFVDVLTRPI